MDTMQGLDDTSRYLLQNNLSSPAGLAALASTDSSEGHLLSEREQQLLQVHDRLEEIELETALREAQCARMEGSPEIASDVGSPSKLEKAERELLEAKATHALRQKIIDSVLVTDPILKAVHSGANATVSERKLRPRIDQRDKLSMTHTNLQSELSSQTAALSAAEAQNIENMRHNADLSTTLLQLVAGTNRLTKEDVEDPATRAQLESLEDDIRLQRRRWRIMKNVVAATIAGSGVDWARDAELQNLVLDAEDDVT
ncbi:MAG: hypothetical protein M1833_004927 [Piccolia ochrophora]|nr:MAG: hypothetical protein M1833_004927 [Piccolia ochrophora]